MVLGEFYKCVLYPAIVEVCRGLMMELSDAMSKQVGSTLAWASIVERYPPFIATA